MALLEDVPIAVAAVEEALRVQRPGEQEGSPTDA